MQSDSAQTTRVSVIVLSWNRRDDLRACLEALRRQTYSAREVVVMDNGSTDGTAEMVSREFPEARLIRSETNLGFAAGNNLAIRATDALYVATLNNDAIAEPEWLERLVAIAEADPTLGSIASKMVFQHDPATINSCGIAIDRAGIAWDLLGGLPASLVRSPREVFGACAGAALYRRSMLDDVGVFDEDFFAYLEDVDLAWRAQLRGWRCLLAPDAVVRHAHSGTLGEGSPLKRYLLARNKVWTIAKSAPASRLRTDLPLMVLYDLGAVTFAVARHRDWASLRGRLAGLAGLPRVLRKRRDIQQRRTADDRLVARLYSPLAAPWDVPKRYRHLVAEQASGARDQGSRVGGQGTGKNARPLVELGRALAIRNASQRPTSRERIRRLGLNLAGALLSRPTPRPPTPDPRPLRKVVVLRPDHLGDVLLSRPAIEALVELGLEVTVAAGPWGTASLQGLPVRVVAFPFPGFTRSSKGGFFAPYAALLAFAAHLSRERYDAALVLRPDHWWGALAAALAGIPIRVGHAHPDTSPSLTHRVALDPTEHAMRTALRSAAALADALGLRLGETERPVRFEPSPEAQQTADAWLSRHVDDHHPLVVLHPGAGADVKTWPARRWATIADDLAAEAALVCTGSPAEAAVLDTIRAAMVRPLSLVTDLTWDQLAALYRRADAVVGMDSGPLHLASAIGTPTVRVYGPSDPRIYGPASSEYDCVLQGTLPCVPCGNLVLPPCGYLQDPPCLASVGPRDLVAAVRSLLPVPSSV